MRITTSRRSRTIRAATLGLTLAFVAGACNVLPTGLFAVDPTAAPNPTPTDVCGGSNALRASVEELVALDVSEVGMRELGASIDVVTTDARLLLEAVGDELRPFVLDLIVSLDDLRASVDGLPDEETLGSKIASIGESMVGIGEAADALEVRLRTRCPVATAAPSEG